MGLFGGSKSSSKSTTTNYSTTSSQSLGDLSKQNIQATGDVTVNGLYGEDAQAWLDYSVGLADKSITNVSKLATDLTGEITAMAKKAAASNSDLAGAAIQQVAAGYQSAYSETTGILQQLKPVLMVGAGVLAMIYAPKLLRSFK